MHKWAMIILAALLLLLPGLVPAQARAPRGGGGDSDYSGAGAAEDDRFLENEDLANIAFIQKNEAGEDMVFIRIPPAMYRLAKARSRVKRRGAVRVKLRPRHYQALEAATGHRPDKVILRIRAKRLRKAKGLSGHYVVRPLSQFAKGDASDTSDGDN